MSGTRENGWLQKLMYVLIVVLGVYILYKGTFLLMQSESLRQAVQTGPFPQAAEDAAARTYAPGYAAAVEGKGRGGWLAWLLEPLVPVFSYYAELQTEETEAASLARPEASEHGQAYGTEACFPEETDMPDPELTQDPENVSQRQMAAPEKAESEQTEEMEASSGQGQTVDPEEAASEQTKETEASSGQEQTADPEETASDQTEETEEGSGQELTGSDSVEASGLISGPEDRVLEQLRDFHYLLTNYYTLDTGTTIDGTLLDVDALLQQDLSIQKDPEVPQILIYHTHSQEYFADSVEGDPETSILAAGGELARILRETYGYQVIHDTGVYDLTDGVLDRSAAYDYARSAVEQILEEHPTIEVVIDLHRDGVDGQKFVTEVDGKPASMIMFFNGLSRDETGAPLTWLENPYLEENLAFSLQLQLKARAQYPGYTRNIYLKAERFNLHLRPRSLLVEAGTQLNTLEEELNAMEPLAELLAQVLGGA